ncbi:hypothetical protein Lal_00041531 [Lupinus albus]|nr:hypothetical protein Lal_00041531 [Lupinus albus]
MKALGTKGGETSVYGLTKVREIQTKDLGQVKCIKYKDEKLLNYFHKFFNEGHYYLLSNIQHMKEEVQNYTFYRRIQEFEVKEVLKRMKNDEAVELDNIFIEAWKVLGKHNIR